MDRTTAPPSVAETHISVVSFIGDRAYKLLKPVRNDFLDYSTTASRLAAVEAELRLNRRLSPDVYLGTADVHEQGELVDQMLVMRRLPADRRLSTMVRRPGWEPQVRAVARAVAQFHASLPPLTDEGAIAGSDAVLANWEDNTAALAPFAGPVLDPDQLDRVVTHYRRYHGGRRGLFDQRIAEGQVRDTHGDLTADDIFCLDDGPRILDCLAFDRRLRVSDVLADIAFLAMDLDRLAGPVASQSLMAWYAEHTNEHHPSSLAHHYVAYRAQVRAKVACLSYEQGQAGAAEAARGYLALCLDHLERAAVRLVLVGGGPGTGKTTLTQQLSSELGWLSLSSDELRKDLTGHGHGERLSAGLNEGIYQPEITVRTYTALLERAELLLARGESTIIDASWSRAGPRQAARQLAARAGVRLVELECDAPPDLARQRIRARQAEGLDASDATPDLVEPARRQRDPWPEAAPVDTTTDPAQQLASALQRLRRHEVHR
jgi:aminoglycoside phosphotransferase family enzyme/predicted kinase